MNVAPYFIGVNEVGSITDVLESGLNVVTGTPRGSNSVYTITAQQISGDRVGASVLVEQLQGSVIGDSLYRINFAADQSWSLTNVTSGQVLLTGQTSTSGGFDSPIVSGFMPRVLQATDPTLIFQIEGGAGLLGATDSINLFLPTNQADSSGVWHLSNLVDDTDITWYNFADDVRHDYIIRVLTTASEPAWEYNFGDPSPQAAFNVPFEIYDLGECSAADLSDDVKVSAMIRDDDGSGSWTWGDRVYIRRIPFASVAWGTPGIMSTDYAPLNDDQTLGRFAFSEESAGGPPLPVAEARVRVRGGRLCPSDVFQFRTVPSGSAPGTIVGNDVKKILAVPNPYYAHSQYELTQFDRTMKFTNIPASRDVTIRIFSLAGDLVRTIRRSASSGDDMSRAEIRWDLNTDNRLPVGSGVYIYRVDVEGVGSKTDRVAVFIEKERLDNF
jgi:hypothetical protein